MLTDGVSREADRREISLIRRDFPRHLKIQKHFKEHVNVFKGFCDHRWTPASITNFDLCVLRQVSLQSTVYLKGKEAEREKRDDTQERRHQMLPVFL